MVDHEPGRRLKSLLPETCDWVQLSLDLPYPTYKRQTKRRIVQGLLEDQEFVRESREACMPESVSLRDAECFVDGFGDWLLKNTTLGVRQISVYKALYRSCAVAGVEMNSYIAGLATPPQGRRDLKWVPVHEVAHALDLDIRGPWDHYSINTTLQRLSAGYDGPMDKIWVQSVAEIRAFLIEQEIHRRIGVDRLQQDWPLMRTLIAWDAWDLILGSRSPDETRLRWARHTLPAWIHTQKDREQVVEDLFSKMQRSAEYSRRSALLSGAAMLLPDSHGWTPKNEQRVSDMKLDKRPVGQFLSTKLPVIILYHADADGTAGACLLEAVEHLLLSKRSSPAWSYFAVNYGDNFDFLRAMPPSFVVVVDFSLDPALVQALRHTGFQVLHLDHHRTAYLKHHQDPYFIYDETQSGCGLVYRKVCREYLPEYFGYDPLIAYVEDRDLWRHALPLTKEINAWLSLHPVHLRSYQDLRGFLRAATLQLGGDFLREPLTTAAIKSVLSGVVETGRLLVSKFEQDVQAACRLSRLEEITPGVGVRISNGPMHLRSELGATMLGMGSEGIDVYLSAIWAAESVEGVRRVKVSLRSREVNPDQLTLGQTVKTVNCGKLAAACAGSSGTGGGHQAAGSFVFDLRDRNPEALILDLLAAHTASHTL